jgi:plasmid stabilization system protein ParE
VAKKRLELAARALRDIEAIEAFHLEVAGENVANRIVDAILTEAEKVTARAIKIARVLHQRSEYFNRTGK